MSELTLNRTPDLIAAEINHIKEQTRIQVLNNSIEIGRKLVEAKSLVSHGEWGVWLEKKVDYSKSTANNLMNIFEKYADSQMSLLGNNAKSQAIGELGYTQALTLLGIHDDEEREKFIEENNVNDMSTRELKKAIEDLNKTKSEKEALEKELKDLKSKSKAEKDKLKEEAKHNENIVKYKVHFDGLVAGFKALLEDVSNINAVDPEEAKKYSDACKSLINMMSKRL